MDVSKRRRAAGGAVADSVQPDRRSAACCMPRHRSSRSSRSTRPPECARWTFDPFAGEAEPNALGVNRGVVFWESGEDQRILVAAGQRLYALDARTGKPVASFGQNGSASLKEGLGERAQNLYVLSNTPGAIYQDLLIIGTRLSEGPGPSAPGHIRAFDVRTGRLALGVQDDSRSRANSATTPGPPTPGRTSAAPMRGAASPSTRRGAWCFCRPARRPSTSGAATATARTCLPTRCSCSRRPRANASGTTSSCTTICGIATCHRRRCWSR